MKIYDTLTNQNVVSSTSAVSIYVCGVTVYDDSHVGHMRTIIVFDVLRRYLESMDITVTLVQNFTDVDDKIIQRAIDESTTPKQIAKKYINEFLSCSDKLNIKRASQYPVATEHISEIQDMISQLMEKEIAYSTETGVYYNVGKFLNYGKLSGKHIDELEAGARVGIDSSKNNPLDFALWKFSNTEPNWSSPWGCGRPGWHIECSAMSLKYLGNNFDIHGGGRDLIFPHHENEIAQSESCTDKPTAKCWMHVGMVTLDGEKMSKSLGNTKTARQVIHDWGSNVTRLFCLSGHYAKPIDYTPKMLLECTTKWRQIESAYHECLQTELSISETLNDTVSQIKQAFDSAINDNLNTHLALSALFQLGDVVNNAAASSTLSKNDAKNAITLFHYILNILGLKLISVTSTEIQEIQKLMDMRIIYRKEKKFAEADSVRDKITSMNVDLLDHNSGTIWIKRESIFGEKA